MKRGKEEFDAVKFMRNARDGISRDIQGMSHEEQLEYFKEHSEQARRKLVAAEQKQAV
jgi:hypothetical protein